VSSVGTRWDHTSAAVRLGTLWQLTGRPVMTLTSVQLAPTSVHTRVSTFRAPTSANVPLGTPSRVSSSAKMWTSVSPTPTSATASLKPPARTQLGPTLAHVLRATRQTAVVSVVWMLMSVLWGHLNAGRGMPAATTRAHMTACVHLGMCCQLTGSLVKVGMLWFHEWSQMCSHGLQPSILHLPAEDSYTCTF